MLKLSGSTIAILEEGMGGRMKTKNGQLRPLKARTSKNEQRKRALKIAARRTVAEQLVQMQQGFAAAVGRELYRRTLRGRIHFAYLRVKHFFSKRVKQAA